MIFNKKKSVYDGYIFVMYYINWKRYTQSDKIKNVSVSVWSSLLRTIDQVVNPVI